MVSIALKVSEYGYNQSRESTCQHSFLIINWFSKKMVWYSVVTNNCKKVYIYIYIKKG